jgi:hypothetical protein
MESWRDEKLEMRDEKLEMNYEYLLLHPHPSMNRGVYPFL